MNPDARRFATTHWTLVISAGDPSSPSARHALATLCETYWFPVYFFIRRSGRPDEDARDLTQAFFTRVLEKHTFTQARQERGRFRSFLLRSVNNFLLNQRDWDAAIKRGGGKPHLSLEIDDDDRRYQFEPADHLTPGDVYERQWATAVMENAMARLEFEQGDERRKTVFRALKPFLDGNDPQSYSELAHALDSSVATLRVAVHRIRKQFGRCLREAIRETVDRDEDVDDELRHLLAVVSR